MKMLQLMTVIFACAFLTYLPAAEPPTSSDVQYTLPQERTKWKLGNQTKSDNQSIEEYIPENETMDNWTEQFSVHRFKDVSISVDRYYDAFIKELIKLAPETKIEHRILNKDDNHSLMGEWWIDSKSSDYQHEWFRVFSNGKDAVILRYTTKSPDNIEQKKTTWEAVLKQASFSQTP